jgi:hypothetical protein
VLSCTDDGLMGGPFPANTPATPDQTGASCVIGQLVPSFNVDAVGPVAPLQQRVWTCDCVAALPSCWRALCSGVQNRYFPLNAFIDANECESQGYADYCVGATSMSCVQLNNNASCPGALTAVGQTTFADSAGMSFSAATCCATAQIKLHTGGPANGEFGTKCIDAAGTVSTSGVNTNTINLSNGGPFTMTRWSDGSCTAPP